ncbi:PAS domain S-box protein [Methanolobus sp. ZRKC5]|uniref:PAS domain S-box protein n=1 Tax=unclassified Methanolobus TaxID=2629569 RepID=UPI00313CF865
MYLNKDGKIFEVNKAYCTLSGYTREELLDKRLSDLEASKSSGQTTIYLLKVMEKGNDCFETKHRIKDGSILDIKISMTYSEKAGSGFICFLKDISKEKLAEAEREITTDLLSLLKYANDQDKLIPSTIELLQKWSGCEAVGIRLKEGEDYPYYQTKGFPESFVLLENSLCSKYRNGNIIRDEIGNPILECMCGNVIHGRFNPDMPFFTAHGSFWTNSSTELLASTDESDRLTRTRNRCNGEGYESVALIPLRSQGEALGLIQLNDSCKEMFTAEMIALFERLADRIALAISKQKAQNLIQQNEERLDSIFKAAPVGIGVVIDRVIVDINPRMSAIVGYTPDELLGCPASMLYPTQEDFDYVGNEKYRQIKKKGTGTVETRLKRKDGTIIDVILSSTPIDSSDMTKGVTFTVLDITKHKETEIELRESEERFKVLHNASFGGISIHDKGMILDCNRGLSEITGYSYEEMVGMDGLLLIAESFRSTVMDNIFQGYEKPYEVMGLRKDGSVYPLRLEAKSIPHKGKQVRVVEFRNITEQKKTEKALKDSEEKQSAMIANISDVIAIVDKDGINKYKSPNIEKWFGWLPEEVVGVSTWENIHPDDLDHTQEVFATVISRPYTTVNTESRYRCKDGSYKWIEFTAINLLHEPIINGILLNYHDITERKEVEEKLRESEALLNEVGRIGKIGGWELDLITGEATWTPETARIHELDNDAAIGVENGLSFFPLESREIIENAINNAIEKGEPYDHELEFITAKGNHKWVRTSGRPKITDGKLVKVTGVLQDITERKKAEDELKFREEKYRSLFEQASDSIIIHDFDGKIVDVNKTVCEMFGYTEEELKQKSILELIVSDEREEMIEKVIELRLKGSLRNETRMLRSDGDIFYIDVSASVVHTQKNLIQAVGRDISDRIKAEAAMLNAKIEAETASRTKSEFIANISHELRTPLNSIIGFSDIMLDGIAGELVPQQEGFMHHISNSGHHLLTLINDILDVSKIEAGKMNLRFDMVDVKTIIDEIVTMTQTLTSEKKITVGIELPENMPKILADKSKLKQILYNLIGNAIKFTDNCGKIIIRTEVDDGIIRISVIDTGIGISRNDLKKLFKPFIQIDSSISRKYEGTGLGLALVKELVELHSGKIWVESELGNGSTFIFEIPVKDGK